MMTEMLNPDNYAFTAHAITVMVVGSAIAALGIFVAVREGGSDVGTKFLLFAACIFAWLMTSGAAYSSRTDQLAIRWAAVSQVAVAYIPAAILALSVTIGRQFSYMRIVIMACLAASTIFSAVILTTDIYVTGVYRYDWGLYVRYGAPAALYAAYLFCVMAFTLILYYRAFRQATTERNRKRLKGVLIAFAFGYMASFDFLPGFGIPVYPFGYIAIMIFLVIIAWVILRYRLVDITPALAADRILETMHGAVIVTDTGGIIRIANPSACAMLGYESRELVGRELKTVVETPPEWTDRRMLRERTLQGGELIWTGKSGRRVHVSVSASLITDRDGTSAGAAYVASDITERKKAEARLKQFAEDLEQANEEMKNFAYIVSHDLRAPLVSIKGFSSELEYTAKDIRKIVEKYLPAMGEDDRRNLETFLNEDFGQALGFISSSVTRMDGLINAVLALSRMGRRELKPERVDMNAVTRNILSSLAHQIEARRVQVRVGSLPEITADKVSAEQIMGNILDNALKYLDPGRRGELDIFSEVLEGENIFHVRDNGRGIAEEDIPKVFEIFRRAGNQDVPGEGMGLAYVKTLVRRHGGRIWCESEPGKGSAFSFTIPRKIKG